MSIAKIFPLHAAVHQYTLHTHNWVSFTNVGSIQFKILYKIHIHKIKFKNVNYECFLVETPISGKDFHLCLETPATFMS